MVIIPTTLIIFVPCAIKLVGIFKMLLNFLSICSGPNNNQCTACKAASGGNPNYYLQADGKYKNNLL